MQGRNEFTKKLENLIRDCSVVFCGPANYLSKLDYGKQIDAADIVIRTNDAYVIPDRFKNQYGSKCDILYLNNSWIRRNLLGNRNPTHLRNLIKEIIAYQRVKLVVVKGDKSKNAVKHYFEKVIPSFEDHLEIHKTSFNWREDRELWYAGNDASERKYYEPTLLSYIISDLSAVGVFNKILITGCDFYLFEQHWGEFYNKTVNPTKEVKLREKYHDMFADIQYLKRKLSLNKKIKCDKQIAGIIQNH